jgi:hypothetical protein
VSLDGLPPAHLRVLLDVLPVFERYGLPLAGGYAFRAYEILHRPSQDLDFATGTASPLRPCSPSAAPQPGLTRYVAYARQPARSSIAPLREIMSGQADDLVTGPDRGVSDRGVCAAGDPARRPSGLRAAGAAC